MTDLNELFVDLALALKYGDDRVRSGEEGYEPTIGGTTIRVMDFKLRRIVIIRRKHVRDFIVQSFDLGQQIVDYLDSRTGFGPTKYAVSLTPSGAYVSGANCLSSPAADYDNDRSLFVWIILHEYMHRYQTDIGKYLVLEEPREDGWRAPRWHGSIHEINQKKLSDEEYGKLPWEAEADAFANANSVHVCSHFNIDVVKDVGPQNMQLVTRYNPNGAVDSFVEPTYWHYRSSRGPGGVE